ncbi:MAG: TrmJ/YjtD family RNA methyltransferase [Bryobacterales bacterium]|nr:TrmJ/YjtD family RNA methyltransferase [Bryobacterales bacterium]
MSLAVVLVSPRNPLNIGAAARAMSNFGFLDLRLVRPYDVAWQEARSAVGAAQVLRDTRVFATVAEAIADCSEIVGTASLGHRELQHSVRRLEYGGRLIREQLADGQSTAILFGSEKYGLSNDDLSHCRWLMRIPTREEHESMNLGQAVAVCLYELVRRDEAAQESPKPKVGAVAADVQRIEEITLEILRDAGYLKPPVDESSVRKVRRLLQRLEFNTEDARIWLGMLRQIRWRLNTLKSSTHPDDI